MKLCYLFHAARLAQLVEHPLDVGRVRGSSPLSRTTEMRLFVCWAGNESAEIAGVPGRGSHNFG